MLDIKTLLPELKKLVKHDNPFVCYAATRAIFECGDHETVLRILQSDVSMMKHRH